MGTTISKTYSITVKYSRDDDVNLGSGDLAYTELRTIVMERLAGTVPISQGITSAHIMGSVSEA